METPVEITADTLTLVGLIGGFGAAAIGYSAAASELIKALANLQDSYDEEVQRIIQANLSVAVGIEQLVHVLGEAQERILKGGE
jgi:hypothetical protein